MPDPASEDLLSAELIAQFRRDLLPVWLKVLLVIVVLIAGFCLFVLTEAIVSAGLGRFIKQLSVSWKTTVFLLVLLDCAVMLPAVWMLLREKKNAVIFAMIVLAGLLLPCVAAVGEMALNQFVFDRYPRLQMDGTTVFFVMVIVLTIICIVKLLMIHKEWKLRVSKTTGR